MIPITEIARTGQEVPAGYPSTDEWQEVLCLCRVRESTELDPDSRGSPAEQQLLN